MHGKEDPRLAKGLCKYLVERLAPRELPLVDDIAAEYDENTMAISHRPGQKKAVGFGVGEAAALLTPAALTVAHYVLGLLDEAAKAVIRDLVAGKRDAKPPTLSAAEMARIRRDIFDRARTLLDEKRARLLADAIVGLLLSTPEEPVSHGAAV